MKAQFDFCCGKCRRRFGWYGHLMDAPPCPKCRTRIPKSTLESDLKKINEVRQVLKLCNELPTMCLQGTFKEALELATECFGNQYSHNVIKDALRYCRDDQRASKITAS